MLLVQDNTQERIVDVDLAVVLNEAPFPEFVHEQIDPRPSCANHLREHLLRYFGKHLLSRALRAIVRRQQQSARQPFLSGVEELVYQVLLDPHVSRKHISDEAVGKLVFLVERANHLVSLNGEHGFFAGLIDYSKLHSAFLNVHYILRAISLREDGLFS